MALYPGSSAGKEAARDNLMDNAERWWRRAGRPPGRALVLAGHGGDVRRLRPLFAPDRVIACDTDPAAVARWNAEWPEAPALLADVGDVIAAQPDSSLAFVFLDLCGLVQTALPFVRALANKLQIGAVFALTLQRAREPKHCQAQMTRVARRARAWMDAEGFDIPPGLDDRAIHNVRVVGDTLDAAITRFSPAADVFDFAVTRLLYMGTSPMEVVVYIRARTRGLRPKTHVYQYDLGRGEAQP